MAVKDGGPAFPVPSPCYDHGTLGELFGMTLRDHVAIEVLKAIVISEGAVTFKRSDSESILELDLDRAFKYADAFIARRESGVKS